jgi:hypothetical protein
MSDFCRAVGIGASEPRANVVETTIQTPRFFNIGTIKGQRYRNLTALTTPEVHDCSKLNQALKNVAASTTGLRRLVIVYTGFMKNGKMAEIDGAGADALRKILKNFPKLEELRVFVKSIPTNKDQRYQPHQDPPIGLTNAHLRAMRQRNFRFLRAFTLRRSSPALPWTQRPWDNHVTVKAVREVAMHMLMIFPVCVLS